MKEYFKKLTIAVIVSAVIAFIIGLMMAVIPNISLQIIGIMVGIYLMVHGCALIVLNFMAHRIYIPFHSIMSGLLSIIIGIILIAMPNALANIFSVALGIWIILSSANIISLSIYIKDAISNWYLWLLLGIIDLICGFIILFNPFASSLSLVVLGGIMIMIHSIVTIIGTVMLRKDAKEVIKAFEGKIKEPAS